MARLPLGLFVSTTVGKMGDLVVAQARELFFVFLTTRPEFKKPKQCRRNLIGPMREFLAKRTGVAILAEFSDVPEKVATLIKSRASAQDDLTDFCSRCRRCELGREL